MDQIFDMIFADYQEQFKEPAGVQLLQAMGYNLDLFQMTLDRFQEVLTSFGADLDEQAIALVQVQNCVQELVGRALEGTDFCLATSEQYEKVDRADAF